MGRHQIRSRHFLAAMPLALLVSACGGAGSGVSSVTPPPPAPGSPGTPSTPATSLASTAPLANAPEGVTATTDLEVGGVIDHVRWNATLKAYEVDVAGLSGLQVVPLHAESFAQAATLKDGNGPVPGLTMQAWTGYRFTRSGYFNGLGPGENAFVFGVATPAAGVPTTGNATYRAELTGQALNNQGQAEWGLYGLATFNFDFAAGSLGGHMDPVLNGPMEVPPVPRYDFTDTHFAVGRTSFSGAFSVAGPTPSSFQGQFTGPHAEELMASFRAPYYDSFSGKWGEISGVMAGKR
jgi:hypothetical protein